jgi:hypothetical protein
VYTVQPRTGEGVRQPVRKPTTEGFFIARPQETKLQKRRMKKLLRQALTAQTGCSARSGKFTYKLFGGR